MVWLGLSVRRRRLAWTSVPRNGRAFAARNVQRLPCALQKHFGLSVMRLKKTRAVELNLKYGDLQMKVSQGKETCLFYLFICSF
jgi:hypothetical protein